MSNPLLAAALACIKAGVSIIPIDHKTKRPAASLLPGGKWKPYQSAIADEATVRGWFALGIKGFAVVGGNVSRDLLILDFDAPGYYERWSKAVGKLADGLSVQQTGGGGYQVFFRCPSPGGNARLAWAIDESESTGRTIAIETRGEGGYAVIAPSLHPSGNQYKWLIGDVASIPVLTQEHADKLLAAARGLDDAPFTRQEREGLESQARDSHRKRQTNLNGQASVIDAFNTANSIEAVLERHGYATGSGGRYIRPGGENESVSVKDGRSCHWSSNDPLNDGRGKGGCGCHDAFDLFAHYEHGGDLSKAVKAAAELLRMNATGSAKSGEPWPDPLSLPPGLPSVVPFNYDLLPASMRPWVKDVSERMQCPAEFVAVAMLASAGSLIGRKIGIRPKRCDDWQVVANLWALLIGPPSLMKSPAMREGLKTIHRLQADAEREYAKALEEHAAKQFLSEAEVKADKQALQKLVKAGKRTEAEALSKKMAEGQNDCPPAERVYIVNDATVEALGVVLNQNPDGVLLVRDELAGWLRTMDREGHENDRAFYLQAWDGLGGYTYRRIERGTLQIESVTLSVVGTIQPGVLSDYIRQAVTGGSGDDGLSQRFQLAVWPDTPATWQNIDRYPDANAKAAADEALNHLAKLTPTMVEAEFDTLDREALPFLRFDAAAQTLFDGWHADLMRRCRSGNDHAAIESHLLKYKKLVPALALIFHFLERGKGAVAAEATRLALGWATYLESHARRIYAVVGRAPALSARLLAKRIRKGELSDNFTARDVYNHCWSGLDRERTQAALDVLVSAHWLEERADQTGGRPTTRYAINPKIRDTQGGEPAKPSKVPFAGFAGSVPQVVADFETGSDNEVAEASVVDPGGVGGAIPAPSIGGQSAAWDEGEI